MAKVTPLYEHPYPKMTPSRLLELYEKYGAQRNRLNWERIQASWLSITHPAPTPEENHAVRQMQAIARHLWPETYDQPAEVIPYEEIRQLRTRNSHRGGASSYTL